MIICFQTHPYPVLLILAISLNVWDENWKVILELSSLPSHIPFTPHLSRPLPHWSVTSCLPVQLSLLRQTLYLIIDWLVQLLSWVWLFVTPWPATCQASLTSTIFQSLLKFTSMESVMLTIWPYALSSAFSLSHHQGLFQWFRWPKYLELQL